MQRTKHRETHREEIKILFLIILLLPNFQMLNKNPKNIKKWEYDIFIIATNENNNP